MTETLTYAKAGGPPDDWQKLRIVHADGSEDTYVVEANAKEGWLIRYKCDENGKVIVAHDDVVTERVVCAFRIERRPQ